MKVAMTIDKAQSNKLSEFRKKHISDNQIEGSKKLGISQANLSKMESGSIPVNSTIINKLVNDFNMSKDWFFHSEGDMIIGKKSKSKSDIPAFREEVAKLQTEVLMLNKTLQHLVKIIERQGNDIEDLKTKLNQK